MMGAHIVETARSWIGTPYVHQASVMGAGTDCLGLVHGVWREVLGPLPAVVPSYSMDWSESAGDERLWRAAVRYLVEKPIADEAPGDVLLFRMKEGAVAKHLGIVAAVGGQASFVHAYWRHGVVESALSTPWRRRLVARFEFPKENVI